MMQKTYSCPKCGHTVTTKDINVPKDILLCPSCGEVSSFSAIVEQDRERAADDAGRRLLSAPPPKHLKVESDPTDMTGRIVMTYRKFSKSMFFLLPFTLVWSGGSMVTIYGMQIMKRAFDWKLSLFGLPFLVGSVFLVSACLFGLFGKRVLTLARGQGRYFFGVGPIGWTKRFTFDRRTRVEQGYTSYQSSGQSMIELHLTHPDSANTVRVCAGLDEDALDYVEAVLKREIGRV